MNRWNQQLCIGSATISIPASAGEIVQGQLISGEDFLVTNPVQCFSTIQVFLYSGKGEVIAFPPECIKVKRAATATLQFFAVSNLDVHVYIESRIPVGKGMASSTADIVGTVEAIAQALGEHITPEGVSKIAIAIEPSDGLMHRGTVIYNHRRGELLEYLGPVPPMRQLIVDSGESIDTIEFNRRTKDYTGEELAMLEQALHFVREGIKTRNLAKIGKGATISTLINQRLLPKSGLDEILQIAYDHDAQGIACAHSGTILSLFFDLDNVYGFEKAKQVLVRRYERYFDVCSIHSW